MVPESAHISEMKTHLESEKKELGQNPLIRKDVTARVRPEPENGKDEKAIIIDINYGGGYKPVGYIAKELAKFLHLLIALKKIDITDVGIKYIKFRTAFTNISYYIMIIITRKGPWVTKVIAASAKVP